MRRTTVGLVFVAALLVGAASCARSGSPRSSDESGALTANTAAAASSTRSAPVNAVASAPTHELVLQVLGMT